MNKNLNSMNKINIDLLEYPRLRIEAVHTVCLSPVWNGITLAGHYWRLYHNSGRGAGVFLKGRALELHPECFYLLAPNCNLRTWLTGNPLQTYIHFDFTGITGNPDSPFHEFELDEGMRDLFESIRGLCKKGQGISPRLSLLAVHAAARAVCQMPEESLSELSFDARISRCCTRIRGSLPKNLSIALLARESGMAPNSFLRRFREVTGTTPYRYLLNLRYHAAARLLEESSLGIDEICEQVGVRDRFHFSRCFKGFFGLPPAAYRKARKSGTGNSNPP